MKNSESAQKRKDSKGSRVGKAQSPKSIPTAAPRSATGSMTVKQLPTELWAAHRQDHDENGDSETLGVCVSRRDAAIVALNAALECAQDREAKLFYSTDASEKPITREQAFQWLLKGMPIVVIDTAVATCDLGEYDKYVAFCISSTTFALNPKPLKTYRVHVTERYSDSVDVVAESPEEASEIVEEMINSGKFDPSDTRANYDRDIDNVTELGPEDE